MPLRLLWRNVLGHPVRAVLTVLSVGVAVFLICMLHAVVTGLARTVDAAASNRLLVQSAVSLFVDLPLSYQQKIAQVPGVEAICKWQWFGGRYEQDKGGFFAQFGIDPEPFRASYPEFQVADGSYEDFLRTRTACLVGRDLAVQYGWRVGQTVPIRGTTSSNAPSGSASPPASPAIRPSSARSSRSGLRSRSAKQTCRAPSSRTPGASPRTRASSRALRCAERAGPPRRISMRVQSG